MNKSRVLVGSFCLALFSCGGSGNEREDSAGCGDLSNIPIGFDVVGMELELMVETEYPQPYWRIFGEEYSESSSVPFDNLVMSIDSVDDYIYRASAENNLFRFSFVSKAHACSIVPPSTSEMVVDFNITSSNDFDDTKPAGASLNALFDVIWAESETDFFDYVTLDNGEGAVSFYSVGEYMNQEVVIASNVIQLRLNTMPQYPNDHVFFINISLDTGESFF